MMSARGDERTAVAAIVGPTAVGKTAVAIELAESTAGEIVSADSRQIYVGMDIGTAKPTASERTRVTHHLIDIVEPSETYDAARYASDAERVIGRLLEEGKRPLVVGGTGFYLESLFEGLFVGPGRDEKVRAELDERADREGSAALHDELKGVDPVSAARIHPNDTSRVVRALEVYRTTGRTLTEWHSSPRRSPAYGAVYFGLRMRRESLVRRIDERVDEMMRAGLVEEVVSLVESGRLSAASPAAGAVGYREILDAIDEGREPATAAERIKANTRRYAKRQMTWFGAVRGIRWFDVDDADPAETAALIAASLAAPEAESA